MGVVGEWWMVAIGKKVSNRRCEKVDEYKCDQLKENAQVKPGQTRYASAL